MHLPLLTLCRLSLRCGLFPFYITAFVRYVGNLRETTA